MSDHIPAPPTWVCNGCGDPWPCGTARRQLLAEHLDNLTALHVYMGAQLTDATRDLPNTPAGALWQRFVGWIRSPFRT